MSQKGFFEGFPGNPGIPVVRGGFLYGSRPRSHSLKQIILFDQITCSINVRNVQLLFNILLTKCPKFVEDIFSFIFSNLIFLYAYE